MSYQKLKKNNLPHQFILQKVTIMMLLKVIYLLSYKGRKGQKSLRNITNEVNKIQPDKHKAMLVYTSTKLCSKFNIKDISKKEDKHELA